MVSYTFVVFCVQVCLLQCVLTQCIGPVPGYPSPLGPGYPVLDPIGPLGLESVGVYGGAGVGEVNVIGELPVAGTTLIAGQVPILGAVEFSGVIPAGGIVSVTGTCSCGCGFGAPFVF